MERWNRDSTVKNLSFSEIVAGCGLGCLAGLLVGLTTANVTATVLSSILAIGTAFLGLAGDAKFLQGAYNSGRLIGFSFAMTVALLAGLWLRSHDILAPSSSDLFQEFRPLAGTDRDAWETVAFVKFGLIPKDKQVASAEQREAVKQYENTLFDSVPSWCDDFRLRQGLPIDEQIAWLSSKGGEYAELAERIKQLPANVRPEVVHSFLFYICKVNL